MIVVRFRFRNIPGADMSFGPSIPSFDIARITFENGAGMFDRAIEIAEFQFTLNEIEQQRTSLNVEFSPIDIVWFFSNVKQTRGTIDMEERDFTWASVLRRIARLVRIYLRRRRTGQRCRDRCLLFSKREFDFVFLRRSTERCLSRIPPAEELWLILEKQNDHVTSDLRNPYRRWNPAELDDALVYRDRHVRGLVPMPWIHSNGDSHDDHHRVCVDEVDFDSNREFAWRPLDTRWRAKEVGQCASLILEKMHGGLHLCRQRIWRSLPDASFSNTIPNIRSWICDPEWSPWVCWIYANCQSLFHLPGSS